MITIVQTDIPVDIEEMKRAMIDMKIEQLENERKKKSESTPA